MPREHPGVTRAGAGVGRLGGGGQRWEAEGSEPSRPSAPPGECGPAHTQTFGLPTWEGRVSVVLSRPGGDAGEAAPGHPPSPSETLD